MNEPHDRSQCRKLADRLSEYLDGELPEDLRREVESHFRDCVTCEKFLVSLGRTRELAHLLPRLELPPDVIRKLTESAREELGL